jgi:Sugar (and other) transporter
LQVSLALPSVQEAWGPGYTYLAFCVIAVAAVATIYAIVPETKGKSLEQIEAMFASEAQQNSDDVSKAS